MLTLTPRLPPAGGNRSAIRSSPWWRFCFQTRLRGQHFANGGLLRGRIRRPSLPILAGGLEWGIYNSFKFPTHVAYKRLRHAEQPGDFTIAERRRIDQLLPYDLALLLRRQLSREQRRALVADQLKETPQISDRQIGLVLGVDGKTVGAVRAKLESIAEIPQCDRQTKDGRSYPAERATPATTPDPELNPLIAKPAASESHNPIPDVHAMSEAEIERRLAGKDAEGKHRRSDDATTETLDDLGISKGQSSRWQLTEFTERNFSLSEFKDSTGRALLRSGLSTEETPMHFPVLTFDPADTGLTRDRAYEIAQTIARLVHRLDGAAVAVVTIVPREGGPVAIATDEAGRCHLVARLLDGGTALEVVESAEEAELLLA
ncbi:hypothetical protein LMG23992_02120 [Cupriavidus laharis]|uniref:Uncharacterized protein n=1 Tax=Cupriavidus laharis TaxID=151654 RepID=A0ABM8WX77_9BURK|nr:hypothetical protein [Cupriavidus laharis]CAG9172106.1 hypothetical protein LMG23992_02120 [Cupriavidus laharis]